MTNDEIIKALILLVEDSLWWADELTNKNVQYLVNIRNKLNKIKSIYKTENQKNLDDWDPFDII